MTVGCIGLLTVLVFATKRDINNEVARLPNCMVDLPSMPAPPQLETFDNLEDAERFVCHQILSPRDLRGWQLRAIDAMRWNVPGRIPEDHFWSVNLRFTLGAYSTPGARYLVIMISNGGGLDLRNAEVKDIALGAHRAKLVQYPKSPGSDAIEWHQRGLNVAAYRPDGAEMSINELLPILRSLE